MQYKDLKLDRIEAFAPVPKQIDKQNYKDMAEALMNLGARGADAYASYKINQIPMGKKRDLALAEYQLLRHQDPSALQKIEERRYEDYWRDRQENVQREMLEQSRAEAEAELKKEIEKKRREDEITYNDIIRQRSVLNNDLTNAMKDYNKANASTTTFKNIYDPDTRIRFLREQNTELLNKINENKTLELRLDFKPKEVEVRDDDIRDSVKVKDVKNVDIPLETGDAPSESGGTNQESKNETEDISDMSFDSDDKRNWYLKNKNDLRRLNDAQKRQFTDDYIKNSYKFYGKKIISDGLGEKEKERLGKEFGYKFITEKEKDEAIKKAEAKKQTELLKKQKKAVENVSPGIKWRGTFKATLEWVKDFYKNSPEKYKDFEKAVEEEIENLKNQ